MSNNNSRNFAIVLLASILQSGSFSVDAYLPTSRSTRAFQRRLSFVSPASPSSALATSSSTTSTDFSTFANSLESDFDDDRDDPMRESASTTENNDNEKPWQAKLDDLLDPATNLADRQILLSELLTSNDKIRDDVLDALTNRKIDPLLTPGQKKLQEGTRAVVRQLANDIIPQITTRQSSSSKSSSSSSSTRRAPTFPFFPPVAPADVQSIGNRLFSVVSDQIQKNLEDLQDDLTDPINKIPARLEKQREEVLQEARNVFLEKPEGLEEPAYTVVEKNDLYEIRSYEAYSVVSAAASSDTDILALEGIAAGSAFNTLASYIFGGNDESKVMDMTTPVTTTSAGDMRFYLKTIDNERIPQPTTKNGGEKNSEDADNNNSAVEIVQIPAALLAIREFTGFVTDGEVARQKDTLLQALEMDGIELDVAHGAIVPHVIFQYNSPFTLPMVRLNEIGLPIRNRAKGGDEEPITSLKEEWNVDDDDDELDDVISRSDIE